MSKKKIAIIGSGIAGIATAIRLAARGNQVEVFEANTYPGGKLSEIQLNGYRFDAGPSLFTLPSLVAELFELCGENVEEHFQYQKLAVNCHYFYEDGTVIHAFEERDKFLQEIEHKTSEKSQNVEKVLNNSKALYDYLGEMFMYESLHDPRTYFSKRALNAYRNIWKMDFFRSMNRANESSLTDPRLVQLFNRYATYNGSDPYQTPATMNIIPHLEFGFGAFFPAKGMHHITLALVSLAKRQGVTFHYSSPVQKILTNQRTATGIEVNGEKLDFDRLVSNMDILGTYKKLLPDILPPKRLLSQPKSSSALIFYWGIKKEFPQLDLHNIFFARDYQKEFQAIWKEKTLSDDPTVYINITSKYKKDDAPDGCENWFTMINVPNNSGQDWDTLIPEARKHILEKLSRNLNDDIEKLVEVEEILEPRTIESKTSSAMGALYGNSSNNMFAAFLRHPNYTGKIRNLYFCGGSVHPGGGIPMCLSSAKIVDRYFQ
jgi:phytoene desaturase